MIAVEYLHSLSVAHRDIKLENVLLAGDGVRIRLADFGLAAWLDEWEGDGCDGGAQVGRRGVCIDLSSGFRKFCKRIVSCSSDWRYQMGAHGNL